MLQTLNKNNLHVNDDTCNHFSSPMASSNMFTATYYPPCVSKYDFHPDSPCRSYMHSWEEPFLCQHNRKTFLKVKNLFLAIGIFLFKVQFPPNHQKYSN